MSFQAMAWAIEQRTGSSAAKLVLLMLANYANAEDASCFPSIARLSEECEIGERTAQRAISALEEAGFIEKSTRNRSNGSQSSNRYHLITGVSQWRGGGVTVTPPHNLSLEPIKEEHNLVVSEKAEGELKKSRTRTSSSKNGSPSEQRYKRALETYQRLKASAWIQHRVLSKRARGQVDDLIKAYGSEEAGLKALEEALAYAAGDSWWSDKDVSFENIGSKGRFAEFADRFAAKRGKEDGHTLQGMRQRAEREAGTRDATEQEWSRLSLQTKMLFIQPGQVRDYRNGRYSGRVIVTRKQGSAFWLIPEGGGDEFAGQIAWLGREAFDVQAVPGVYVAGKAETSGTRGGGAGDGEAQAAGAVGAEPTRPSGARVPSVRPQDASDDKWHATPIPRPHRLR